LPAGYRTLPFGWYFPDIQKLVAKKECQDFCSFWGVSPHFWVTSQQHGDLSRTNAKNQKLVWNVKMLVIDPTCKKKKKFWF
jgi:hypothetical protein